MRSFVPDKLNDLEMKCSMDLIYRNKVFVPLNVYHYQRIILQYEIWILSFKYINLYHSHSLSATYVLIICYTPGKAHCIKALYNPQRARKLLAHYLTPRRKLALTESCVSLWRNIGQGWDRRLDAFVCCLCQTLYRTTDAPFALWCQTLLGFTRLNYRFSEINI